MLFDTPVRGRLLTGSQELRAPWPSVLLRLKNFDSMVSTISSHPLTLPVTGCYFMQTLTIQLDPSRMEGVSGCPTLFLSNHESSSLRTPSGTILYPSPTPQLESRRLWRLRRLCSCWRRDARCRPTPVGDRLLSDRRPPNNPLRPNRISVLDGQEKGRVSRRKACPKGSFQMASRDRLDGCLDRCIQNRLYW